jgi:hypothetical protein
MTECYHNDSIRLAGKKTKRTVLSVRFEYVPGLCYRQPTTGRGYLNRKDSAEPANASSVYAWWVAGHAEVRWV